MAARKELHSEKWISTSITNFSSIHNNNHEFWGGQCNKKSLIWPRSANDSFVKGKTLNAVAFLQVAEFHMKWKILVLLMFYLVTQMKLQLLIPQKICLDHTRLPNKPLQKQQFPRLT